MGDLFLIKNTNPRHYLYNVNPAIWKRSCLLEILNKFPHKTYRSIELFDVQKYCVKFNIYL